MNFDQIISRCRPHPNGTYDLYAKVKGRLVTFEWGNSILVATPDNQELHEVVGKEFWTNPTRIRDLLEIETTLVAAKSQDERES